MPEEIPNILYVSREEDGRIVEMIMTEKYKNKYVYYPYNNHYKVAGEDTKFIIWLITYFLFYIQAVIMLLFYYWTLNPYRDPGNGVMGGLGQRVPKTVVHINPEKIFEGCNNGILCETKLPMPIINTTHGEIFPNFTKTGGSPANYKLALEMLLGLMNNQQCNIEIISQKHKSFTAKNSTIFTNLKTNSILALLVLQKNCHPEIVEIVKEKIKLENYGINYLQNMPQYFTECNASWSNVINNTSYSFKSSYKLCNINYLFRFTHHVPYIIKIK
ncbi:orf 27 [Ateline gammaherpesvirus 3]|uniref:Orf 27 n=1 Tax=Ateline herpesvirus 3 TaxID=85618 RepID=Q9YTN9_ATHV3|nr:orf 27 [Ateline gammaherpesvirus 3]AAC95551.1 orf 27 [Ateline gammaherpesvirus 3]